MYFGCISFPACASDKSVRHIRQEQSVCSQIQRLLYRCGNVRAGSLCHAKRSVLHALRICKFFKFIDVPSGLESEVPEQIEGRRFTDDGNRELSGLLDDVMSKVQFIDCNRYLVWICRDLRHGVDDTAIIFFIVFRCLYYILCFVGMIAFAPLL